MCLSAHPAWLRPVSPAPSLREDSAWCRIHGAEPAIGTGGAHRPPVLPSPCVGRSAPPPGSYPPRDLPWDNPSRGYVPISANSSPVC